MRWNPLAELGNLSRHNTGAALVPYLSPSPNTHLAVQPNISSHSCFFSVLGASG
jgi:hypothetical protein